MRMRQEQIGEGFEKIVFSDPKRPEMVIAGIREDEVRPVPPADIKARYYLQKIIHMLFPKNIPDIHLAATKNGSRLRMQKMELDSAHVRVQKIRSRYLEATEQEVNEWKQLDLEKQSDPRVRELSRKLTAAGVLVDKAGCNFAFNSAGEAQYLDNDAPWFQHLDGTYAYNYDENLLLRAIQELSEPEKGRTLGYFQRLHTLKKETGKSSAQNNNPKE